MRVVVHVHPGSRAATVGGNHGGALVVRVRARAIDGAATNEVLDVVATAFGVRRGAVRLVRGATSRRKTLSIEGADEELERRRVQLLEPDAK